MKILGHAVNLQMELSYFLLCTIRIGNKNTYDNSESLLLIQAFVQYQRTQILLSPNLVHHPFACGLTDLQGKSTP